MKMQFDINPVNGADNPYVSAAATLVVANGLATGVYATGPSATDLVYVGTSTTFVEPTVEQLTALTAA